MESVELENVETPRSHLFLVRVWREELGEGNVEWRGRVQAALTSERLYFRDWDGLVTALEKLLELSDSSLKREPEPSVDESL